MASATISTSEPPPLCPTCKGVRTHSAVADMDMMIDDLINVRLEKWRVGEASTDRLFVISLCTGSAAEGLFGEQDKLHSGPKLILGMHDVALEKLGHAPGREFLVDWEMVQLAKCLELSFLTAESCCLRPVKA